jgi:hypothetical protein
VAETFTPEDRERLSTDKIKATSASSSSTAPVLTRDELMALPNGQQLLDEFMAGDNRRRDLQWLPESIAMSIEDGSMDQAKESERYLESLRGETVS